MIEDDIEIEYRPIRKIVILNFEELDKEELFKRTSAMRVVEHGVKNGTWMVCQAS